MNKINKKTIWIGLICLTVLCATVILFIGLKNRKDSDKSDETLKTSVQFDSLKEVSINSHHM